MMYILREHIPGGFHLHPYVEAKDALMQVTDVDASLHKVPDFMLSESPEALCKLIERQLEQQQAFFIREALLAQNTN